MWSIAGCVWSVGIESLCSSHLTKVIVQYRDVRDKLSIIQVRIPRHTSGTQQSLRWGEFFCTVCHVDLRISASKHVPT